MVTPEIVLNRIDRLTEGLSSAVRQTSGAEFALMLSMISESHKQADQLQQQPDVAGDSPYLQSRDDLYTPEIVGRMNEALHKGALGDVQLFISWLETVPIEGRLKPVMAAVSAVGDADIPIYQAAVMASRYTVLDEIQESQHRIAA